MLPHLEIGQLCISCDNCLQICPENSIVQQKGVYTLETWSCTLCMACTAVCPVDCIKLLES